MFCTGSSLAGGSLPPGAVLCKRDTQALQAPSLRRRSEGGGERKRVGGRETLTIFLLLICYDSVFFYCNRFQLKGQIFVL